MRILKSPPENKDFFDQHGGNLKAYQTIGLLGQLLSGISLAYGVYSLLLQQIRGEELQILIPSVAIGVALLIELANRKLAKPAIYPAVYDNPFEGTEAKRHQVLNRSYQVGLAVVALLSLLLSGIGSAEYGDDITEGPVLVSTDSLKNLASQAENDLYAQFSRDTSTTLTNYQIRLEAAKTGFRADSARAMKDRLRYVKCADAGNEWCNNQLNAILAKVDEAQAALADSIAAITTERSAVLADLMNKRDDQLAGIHADGKAEVSEARTGNDLATNARNNKARFAGIIFIVLTVAGQLIFYYMCYLTLQIEAGSGIAYELQPSEFWNLPTVAAEFWTTLTWRTEREARATIRRLFPLTADRDVTIPYTVLQSIIAEQPAGALPAAEQPEADYWATGNDYDDFFSTEQAQAAPVRQSIGFQRTQVDPISNAADNYIGALATVVAKGPQTDGDYELLADNALAYFQRSAKADTTAEREGLQLRAEQVVKAYLGPSATDASVDQLMRQLREHVFQGGPNPFANHHERRRIGFYNGHRIDDDRNTVTVDGERRRDCKHCGKSFTYKHWNKQYCSDECREAAWEKRTGRKLKKGKRAQS